jgi:hypothetical protein
MQKVLAHWPLAVHGLPSAFMPFVQTPDASQNRVVLGSEAQVSGSSFPVGTCAQVPSELLRLHCKQVPLQSVLQQTPSAQWPLPQSEKVVQAWPSFCLHCWVGSQT